jgi:hypothetical protein
MLRAAASIALIFLSVSTACAREWFIGSPLFQGIVLDAKRKIVGRLVPNITNQGISEYFVIRQISHVWLSLPLADLATGFALQAKPLIYYFQSSDCTGQAYLPADQTTGSDILAFGIIATVAPATQPSIYFAELLGAR